MARINIEDSLFRDNRYLKLCSLMGSPEMALGSLVMAWIVAQDFWKRSQFGIPKLEWKKRLLRYELILVNLAEIRGDFVYINGSEKQFAWLTQCIKSGGMGGAAKSLRNSSSDPTRSLAEGKPLTLSPTLSLKTKNNTLAQNAARLDRPCLDFDQIYREYPRKIGKKKGIEKCKAEIKTETDFQNLLSAVRRYAQHCNDSKAEERYVKHFSTFMASWQDWADPETGGCELPKAKSVWEGFLDNAEVNEK